MINIKRIFSAFSFGWICPVLFLTGIPCPGCGMTRALSALLAFDFPASFYWHPMLITTLICLFAAAWFVWKKNRKGLVRLAWIWAWSMILVWLVRLFFVFGPQGWFEPNVLQRLFV